MDHLKKVTKKLRNKKTLGVPNLDLLLTFFLIFSNPWIWRIFRHSVFLALVLIFLTILLIYKKNLVSLLTLLLLSVFLLLNNFDKNLISISPLEKDSLAARHEYFGQGLGRLYKNRIGLYYQSEIYPRLNKFYKNTSYILDPNLYFFASHPRERAGFGEFTKFSALTFPIFLLGLYYLIRNKFNFIHIYFLITLTTSIFVSSVYELGPVLMLPLIVYVTCLGASTCLDLLK